MNMKYETLKDLKKEIHQQIAGLMSNNCVLLNTPNHVNIGDILIWQGEIDFLKSINIEPSYTTSNFNFDWRDFDEEVLILLHGGGNFGDIWEYHQEFRKEVIKKYPNNRILIFPQSVEYNNKETIKEDAILFSKHENITICARDSHSYTLLKEHFKNNTILMVPDMAFCMDIAKKPNKPNKNILLLKRNDRELSETISYKNLEKIEIIDWPTFNPSFKNSYYRVIEKLSKVFSKLALSKNRIDTTFGFCVKRDKNWQINSGIQFISNYNYVASTRLHGHILSLLLNVSSVMIDNSYGKNSRFYDTWLKDIPQSSLVKSTEEIAEKLKPL